LVIGLFIFSSLFKSVPLNLIWETASSVHPKFQQIVNKTFPANTINNIILRRLSPVDNLSTAHETIMDTIDSFAMSLSAQTSVGVLVQENGRWLNLKRFVARTLHPNNSLSNARFFISGPRSYPFSRVEPWIGGKGCFGFVSQISRRQTCKISPAAPCTDGPQPSHHISHPLFSHFTTTTVAERTFFSFFYHIPLEIFLSALYAVLDVPYRPSLHTIPGWTHV
jgi:hypothetical protein